MALPFRLDEFEARVQKVRDWMKDRGVDVSLVTTPENVYYLSGFDCQGFLKGAFIGLVIPAEERPFMLLRALDVPVVRERTWLDDWTVIGDTDDQAELTARRMRETGLRSVLGVEFSSPAMTFDFVGRLGRYADNPELFDVGEVLHEMRKIKSPAEIEYIRHAARIAEAGLGAGEAALAVGASESDLARAVYDGMLSAGGEYPSLHPFVLVGPRTAVAHYSWSKESVISKSDPIHFEIGGCIKRYGAAIMRPAVVGTPTDVQRERAAIVKEGLEAAIKTIRPGVTSGEVDAACRDVFEDAGIGHLFRHRFAYSIGVGFPQGWGESHVMGLRPGDERILQPNMTFHLVPYLMEDGVLGVGMSETVRVTDDGCEVITNYRRELLSA